MPNARSNKQRFLWNDESKNDGTQLAYIDANKTGWFVDPAMPSGTECSQIYAGEAGEASNRCDIQCATGYRPDLSFLRLRNPESCDPDSDPSSVSCRQTYLECWYPGATHAGLCNSSHSTGNGTGCEASDLNAMSHFVAGKQVAVGSTYGGDVIDGSVIDGLCVRDTTSDTPTEIAPEPEPPHHRLLAADWESHRRALLGVLVDAGLAEPECGLASPGEQNLFHTHAVAEVRAKLARVMKILDGHERLGQGAASKVINMDQVTALSNQLEDLLVANHTGSDATGDSTSGAVTHQKALSMDGLDSDAGLSSSQAETDDEAAP